VQSIHAPARLRTRAPRRSLALIAGAAAAVAVVTHLPLSADHATRSSAPATVKLIAGVPLQQARCAQWQVGTARERDAMVDVLAKVAGGASTTGGFGATLSPGETRALFTRTCSSSIARGFLLYEIYNRAAAFR